MAEFLPLLILSAPLFSNIDKLYMLKYGFNNAAGKNEEFGIPKA
jgi:hypothetical protein